MLLPLASVACVASSGDQPHKTKNDKLALALALGQGPEPQRERQPESS